MDTIKIAHISYSYYPLKGGADIYLHNLYNLLKSKGYKQDVFQKWARNLPNYIHPLPPIPRFKGHDYWLLPLLLPFFAPRLSKYPLLLIHYPPYFFPLRWHKGTIAISHGVTWDDAPDSMTGKVKKWFAKVAFNKSTTFVANDTFFLREMGIKIGPGERKFEEITKGRWFIPNCVDTDLFSRVKKEGGEAIIVPRNLYYSRGIHLAIEAFAQVKDKLPFANMIVVGGLGQADYAKYLLKKRSELGLDERVKFLGHISWDRMCTLYREAGLCLIPSLYGEGTSLSALEAMASGVATISTNVGGLLDLPTVKCEPTPYSLAEKILEVFPQNEVVGRWQREIVYQEFSLNLWGQAWLKVIKSTLNRLTEEAKL